MLEQIPHLPATPGATARTGFAKRAVIGLACGLAGALAGCESCHTPGPGNPTPAATATDTPVVVPTTPAPVCAAPPIDVHRSLVVHEPGALAADFSLRTTLEAIIATSGSAVPTTPEALLKTMLDSFAQTSFPQPALGKPIPVDARVEANLSPAELLDPTAAKGMIPVALFNRFDLAPANGEDCGEYRIVYARRDPPFPLERMTLIFESRLPNPNPGAGLAGCQPVAKFWADLSSESDPAVRLSRLKDFYYVGLPTFGAVVRHANFGLPTGQVRTNLFMQFPWNLREHRTGLNLAGAPIFVVDTVKETPLVEWYRTANTLPPGLTPAEQQAFRDQFLDTIVCQLLRPDRTGSTAAFDVVNGIGASFPPAANDFQSVSGPGPATDDVTASPDPAFTAALGARLQALGASSFTASQVLARAESVSCSGCHQITAGKDLGAGHVWPAPVPPGFVHVSETGALSPLLEQFFLPRRAQILARAYCDGSPEPVPTAPCPTPVGAGTSMPPLPAAPVAAAALSIEGLPEAVPSELTAGRTSPSLREVDAARLALLAAGRRGQGAAASASAAADARQAAARLDNAVLRARAASEALPGAFVPVRRTH